MTKFENEFCYNSLSYLLPLRLPWSTHHTSYLVLQIIQTLQYTHTFSHLVRGEKELSTFVYCTIFYVLLNATLSESTGNRKNELLKEFFTFVLLHKMHKGVPKHSVLHNLCRSEHSQHFLPVGNSIASMICTTELLLSNRHKVRRYVSDLCKSNDHCMQGKQIKP